MKKMHIALAVLVAFVAFQGLAFADTVSGKIVSTDVAANSIIISKTNQATGSEENITIWVKPTTTYGGTDSLATLQAGDEVSLEVEQDATTQNWMANSVSRAQAPAPVAPAAAPAAQ